MMYTCDISKNLKDGIARLYIYRRWENDVKCLYYEIYIIIFVVMLIIKNIAPILFTTTRYTKQYTTLIKICIREL